MQVLILPVSGGAFPVQLGILSDLLGVPRGTSGYPDLTLGSSGGNVAAYTALAGDWCPHGIERMGRSLHSGLFVRSWWPAYLRFLPSWILGYFRGSIYRDSEETIPFFQKFFHPHTITRQEIWIGTANADHGKPQFFCNRSVEESLVKPEHFKPKVLGCLEPIYLKGDVEAIARASLASASIPMIVPPQQMGNTCHADGGIFCASPLTVMREIIHTLGEERKGLHMDYISSFDLEAARVTTGRYNLLQVGQVTYHDLVRSLCIQDRLAAIELLRYHGEQIKYTELPGGPETLQRIMVFRKRCCRSLVEYYPTEDISVQDDNFGGEEVVELIKKVRDRYRCRIWWTGAGSFREEAEGGGEGKGIEGASEIFHSGYECDAQCQKKEKRA